MPRTARVAVYVGYDLSESGHAAAGTLDDDTILEQTEMTYSHAQYDADGDQTDEWGTKAQSASYARKHTAGGTGALTGSTARISYAAAWQDAAGRTTHAAHYGTNGGSAPADADPPAASDTVLVSRTNYDAAGAAFESIDPKGIKTTQTHDDAGRLTATIANDVASPAGADEDVTVEREYDSAGHLTKLTAVNATTGDQETRYVYGTALGGASPAVYSNEILRAEIYPDSDDTTALANGTDGTYDRVEYAYDRQGRRIQRKDQAQTVHDYTLDKNGRLLADRVTLAQGSTVDAAILRIERAYDLRGQAALVTSYDAATGGNVKNQVQFTYNDFGQVTQTAQEHAGAVTGNTLVVAYAYADGSDGHIRPTSMTYPNGDQVRYDYGTADGTGDAVNRPVALNNYNHFTQTETQEVAYDYLGLGQVVKADLTVPDLRLDYDSGTAGEYAGLDSFGRVVNHLWENYSDTAVVQLGHGYDRNGNRLWREDVKAAAAGVHLDELYAYDGLNRLVDFKRGNVDTQQLTISKNFEEDWNLDELGNWNEYRRDDTGNGTWELDQDREHDKVNAITDVTGGSWIDPTHDAAGNMTTVARPKDPTLGLTGVYDAWNRLAKLVRDDEYWFRYVYDGLNRRIAKEVHYSVDPFSIQHYYYNEQWQCLEERYQNGGSIPSYAERRCVWGLRYVDDLVFRQRGEAETWRETIYVMQDANFNVVALALQNGDVYERFIYDAYGKALPKSPDFGYFTVNDPLKWEHLYTGRYLDKEFGLMYFRNRVYHTGFGRFVTEDPIGYDGGINLYCYTSDDPLKRTDPMGFFDSSIVGDPQSRCLRIVEHFRRLLDEGAITEEEYWRAVREALGTCGSITPPPINSSQPPIRPACCSGKNCKWGGFWSVKAGTFLFGPSWGQFQFNGRDDTGCAYEVSGDGTGAAGGVTVGYFTITYTVSDYSATCEWPIAFNVQLAGTAVGLGGNVGIPFSISVGQGFAGEFISDVGICEMGGVNAFIGMYALAANVKNISYHINPP